MPMRSLSTAAALIAAPLLFGRAEASPSLNEWVAANASPSEKTTCVREERGEFFFLAMAGQDKVRLGSRVDMSGYQETHEFSVAWVIGNEKAASIVAKVRPNSIRDRYVKEGPRVYADNIQYQTLNTADSKLLRVNVKVEKCAVWLHGSETCKSGRKVYTVKVCEIKL